VRDVILAGVLGREYGRRHRLAVSSPAEAVRAMEANYPGFGRRILALAERGVGYAVFNGRSPAGESELAISGSGKIIISPVINGGKSPLLQIVTGAALIASAFIPGLNTIVASALFSLGVSLTLGGVVQLLAPTIKPSEPQEDERPNNVFDGPVNTTAQGQCVPVGYGRMIVGSAVISAGISVIGLRFEDDGVIGGVGDAGAGIPEGAGAIP